MWLEEHLRHRAGFGVHSPMLYRVVREAMMPRRIKGTDCKLYDKLREVGVGRRTATRLQNLYSLGDYATWSIDTPPAEGAMAIATPRASEELLAQMASHNCQNSNSLLCVIHPWRKPSRRRYCKGLIEQHNSMSASKTTLSLLFRRPDLLKQHIVL
jgi:hypothetical protein